MSVRSQERMWGTYAASWTGIESFQWRWWPAAACDGVEKVLGEEGSKKEESSLVHVQNHSSH